MTINKHKAKSNNRYCRSLISLLLATTSLSQLTLPAFALTAAGTTITNKATATYSDGVNSIATESNTVTITVAEVAGIEIQNTGIDNVTSPGNPLQANHDADFKFSIENTGNDPGKFVIPKSATLTAANAVTNGTITGVTYQLLDSSGNPTGTVYDVDALAGASDGAETISLLAGQKIIVIVKVKVSSSVVTGNPVTVILGNTPTIPTATGITRVTNANDVYTSDNPDSEPTDIDGAPVNGVLEASQTQTATVNQANLLPFVKIEKTAGTYTVVANSGAASPENDTLVYNLKVKVANATTDPGITLPSGVTGVDDLRPTFVPGISTAGDSTTFRVLVSDVLPTNTTLSATPTAPTDWTVVYSETTATTTSAGYGATWSTSLPSGGLSAVEQIGFVYNPTSTDKKLAKGTETDFSFTVQLAAAVTEGSLIRNIAQVFGEKDGITPTSTTTPTVFDESGDAEYNNDSDGNGIGDGDTDSDGDADTLSDPTGGVANGDDPGGNTGSGSGGENNVFTIPSNSVDILNGTVIGATKHPDAVGPSTNNDDFTNKNSAVTSTLVPQVNFDNSLRNTGGADNTFTLVPGNLTDLPDGTTTINLQYTVGATTSTVIYTVVKSGASISTSITGGNTGGNPLQIAVTRDAGIAGGGTATGAQDVQYSVTVDLPDNAPRVQGFNVPIVAFVDTNNDKLLSSGETNNITIDRVYTGFVELLKKSQILDSSGTAVSGSRGTLDINPKAVAPGERIKYAIDYTNISEAQPGTGTQSYNGILTATGMTITERGDDANNNLAFDPNTGNNWAADLDNDLKVDTLYVHGTGTINTTTLGTLAFSNDGIAATPTANDSDTATNTFVDAYTVSGITLAPQVTGTFSFQRKFKP